MQDHVVRYDLESQRRLYPERRRGKQLWRTSLYQYTLRAMDELRSAARQMRMATCQGALPPDQGVVAEVPPSAVPQRDQYGVEEGISRRGSSVVFTSTSASAGVWADGAAAVRLVGGKIVKR